jgi:hypothetical protein
MTTNPTKAKAEPAAARDESTAKVEISRIDTETLLVPIVGTAPLIVHRFSEKAKLQMLHRQQSISTPKTPRDPEAEYQAAFYRLRDGYGFPITAFKAATVSAARFYGKDVKMTELRQFIFMKGEISKEDPQALVPIIGEPRMREDVVRLGGYGSSSETRYRPEFPEWTTTLEVTFVRSCISRSSVLSLIDAGGLGIGVGDWRPEKRGECGTYAIDMTRDVQVVNDTGAAAR